MRIAYIGIKGLPAHGGADRVVEAIIKRMAGRHEITVYCSRRALPGGPRIENLNLIRLPGLSGKYLHMTSVDLLAACHAVLQGNYDLIHLHNIEASFVLPILKLRYKTIATAHGRFTASNKWGKAALAILKAMEYPFAYLPDARTSVAVRDAEVLSQLFQRPVLYIPNGVELQPEVDLRAARRLLAERGLENQRTIVCAAGRVIPLKGIHLALQAFSQLRTDARLVVVGDLSPVPAYTAELQALAGKQVTFLPLVPDRAQFLGLLALSTVFVFPSIVEAMSVTLLEAASVGAPVLCSDIPANSAVLAEHALYFSGGNVGDLATKLDWALEHPETMRQLGEQGRQWVCQQFSWDQIAHRYEELYRSVVG